MRKIFIFLTVLSLVFSMFVVCNKTYASEITTDEKIVEDDVDRGAIFDSIVNIELIYDDFQIYAKATNLGLGYIHGVRIYIYYSYAQEEYSIFASAHTSSKLYYGDYIDVIDDLLPIQCYFYAKVYYYKNGSNTEYSEETSVIFA